MKRSLDKTKKKDACIEREMKKVMSADDSGFIRIAMSPTSALEREVRRDTRPVCKGTQHICHAIVTPNGVEVIRKHVLNFLFYILVMATQIFPHVQIGPM